MSRRSIALMDPRRIFREDLLDDFFHSFGAVSMSDFGMDLYETDDLVVVELEAPNFRPEDVEISVEDQTLTVTGTASKETQDQEEKGRKYYHKEISRQSFSRSVSLPVRVKAESAEATFINGIIKIALPKAEEVKPRKISIKAS